MRVLHLSGHRGEALAAFDRTRTVPKGDPGIEPGADLTHFHQEILTSPPAGPAAPRDGAPPPRVERRVPAERALEAARDAPAASAP